MNHKLNNHVAAILLNQHRELLEPTTTPKSLIESEVVVDMINEVLSALGGEIPWEALSPDSVSAVRVIVEQGTTSPEEDLDEIRTALRYWFNSTDAAVRHSARQLLLNEAKINAPDSVKPE